MTAASHNVRSNKRLAPTEAAYVAGFLDGEGTLTLGRAQRKENRAGFRYQACMMMAQSRRSALKRIVRLCGNGRLITHRKPTAANQKTGYRLQFTANQIRHLLPQLLPYLIVKRAQAKLVLRALAIMPTGVNYSAERWAQIEALRSRLRFLNQRGPTKRLANERTVLPTKRVAVQMGRPRLHVGCSIEGCVRPHMGRGYCKQHYKKFIERGGPALHELVCKRCGTAFTAKRSDAEFCSRQCANSDWYRRKRSVTTSK